MTGATLGPRPGPGDGDMNPHTGIDPTDPAGPSIGQLLANVTDDLSTLLRQELALAKAEAQQSAKNASKGVGMLGGAGVAGNLALIFVSLALMFVFDMFMPIGWAAFTVAVLWAIVAGVLALAGKKEVQKVGMPKTAETTSRIPDALKGNEETR